ncbi:MAG: leucyl aminopeptidase family protein [Rhodospirillales bacterium]|nr:leucyl aminopeptidase family protein [Rhodospirillales bacterium]
MTGFSRVAVRAVTTPPDRVPIAAPCPPGQAVPFEDGWREGQRQISGTLAACAAALATVPHAVLDARGLAPEAAIELARRVVERSWRWQALKRERDTELSRLDVWTDAPVLFEVGWTRVAAALAGQDFCRELVATPANLLTPVTFTQRLTRLRELGIGVEVLVRGDLRRAGLRGLLAVGRASANPPRVVALTWPGTQHRPGRSGGDAESPLAFVGKGLTFDTGGICIKPAEGMEAMRGDMAGAAACAGAMMALALRRSPCPAVAVLALAENAIGADAWRPADVIEMADGTEVEIVDTDAEGRIALADALVWTRRRFAPTLIVDAATLTGSIVVALGHQRAGLFCDDDTLSHHLLAAGEATGEALWRMPLGGGYREALDSDIADLRHCSPERMQPDASQAATFLQHFAGTTPWAHLDIAGVEAHEEADEEHAAGPTGFGVRLLDALAARYEADG